MSAYRVGPVPTTPLALSSTAAPVSPTFALAKGLFGSADVHHRGAGRRRTRVTRVRPSWGPGGASANVWLPSDALEDQHLPALAVERESFRRDLEALHRRQRVLHPSFLPEERLGWAARFRPREVVKAQLRVPHAV